MGGPPRALLLLRWNRAWQRAMNSLARDQRLSDLRGALVGVGEGWPGLVFLSCVLVLLGHYLGQWVNISYQLKEWFF